MANALSQYFSKDTAAQLWPLIKDYASGLVKDFWKDGPQNPLGRLNFSMPELFRKDDASFETFASRAADGSPLPEPRKRRGRNKALWHAEAGELDERMFGTGFVMPGGNFINDKMIKPLGLTHEMSVLDLSAGLGGRISKIVGETGAYVTGLEADPKLTTRGQSLIKRGKQLTFDTYNPETIALDRLYDVILARELFYRVENKAEFFHALTSNLKAKGQMAFTDYILNPEDAERPAIKAWLLSEKGAAPLSLLQMAELWAKYGVNLRVNEELTAYYKKEVVKGLRQFAIFLASGIRPDPETKALLMNLIRIWAHRMAAMDHGLKFYRFYATKA